MSGSSHHSGSALFAGVGSSSLPNSPGLSALTAGEEVDELLPLDDDADDPADDSSMSSQGIQQSQPHRKQRRRRTTMSERDVLDLLRFLKERNLSLAALLSALFKPGPAPTAPTSYPGPQDSPHSSIPSAYSSTAHFLHWRISNWLAGDSPDDVVKRWSGMDEFAVELIAKLIDRETRKASKDEYLAGPSAKKVDKEALLGWDPSDSAQVAARRCPSFQRILDAGVGRYEEEKASTTKPPRKKQKVRHLPEVSDDLIDDDDDEEGSSKKRWKLYGQRSKTNVASTMLHMALFGRSKRCNRFQQAMGLTLWAARTAKRPLELLSRAGVCVSPDTITEMASSLAEATMEESRLLLSKRSTTVSLSIDNLNWLSTVRDKTVTHRNTMMAAVAGNFYLIDDKTKYDIDQPVCSNDFFTQLFGTDVLRPTNVEQPISPLGRDGTPIAMDHQLRESTQKAFLSGPKPDPYTFIVNSEDENHLVDVILSHALRYWIDLHPECSALAHKVPAPPQVFPLVPQKTTVLPLPVYDEDEGSIGGNLKVLESICDDFQLDEAWLSSHMLCAVGDSFTATMQRKGVDRRCDERTDQPARDKLTYLLPMAAFFHFQYSYQKSLVEAHAGSSTEMDVLSVRRLSNQAGFSNLTTGNLDFHDIDAFLRIFFGSMVGTIITTALRKAGFGAATTIDPPAPPAPTSDPDRTLQSEDEEQMRDIEPAPTSDPDRTLVMQSEDEERMRDIEEQEGEEERRPESDSAPVREETTATPAGGLRKFEHIANEFADLKWEDLLATAKDAITDLARARVSPQTEKPDLIYAHATVMLRDLGVYVELRHAVKHGDPGRVLAMVRQAMPRFQSAGQHRYVTECLEMLTMFRFELPPALRQVLLGATLVNHAGRSDSFLAADLDIEHIVHDMKNTFPVQAKAGGLQRQRRIGELLPLLRGMKVKLFKAFSISSVDSSHTVRDRTLTYQRIMTEIAQYAVFEQQIGGRDSSVFELRVGDKRAAANTDTQRKSKQSKHITTDTVAKGAEALVGTSSKPGPITQFMLRRNDQLSAAELIGLDDQALDSEDKHDADQDILISFDAERDMGGFVNLELDVE